MKKIIIYTLFMGAITLLCSAKCSSAKSAGSVDDHINTEYYSGKLSIDSEGIPVRFVDCATHITMDIDLENNYKKIVKSIKKTPKNSVVFVSFTGEILRTEAGERAVPGSVTPIIAIDRILSVGDELVCLPEFLFAGLYSSASEISDRRVLHLRPNYTYTLRVFSADDTETKTEGVWYRNDKLNVVLKQKDGTNTDVSLLKADPTQEILRDIEGEITYSKLYI